MYSYLILATVATHVLCANINPMRQNQQGFQNPQFGSNQWYPNPYDQYGMNGQNPFGNQFQGMNGQYPYNDMYGQQGMGMYGNQFGFPNGLQNMNPFYQNQRGTRVTAQRPQNCRNGRVRRPQIWRICSAQTQCSNGQVCCVRPQNTIQQGFPIPIQNRQTFGRCQLTCPAGYTRL